MPLQLCYTKSSTFTTIYVVQTLLYIYHGQFTLIDHLRSFYHHHIGQERGLCKTKQPMMKKKKKPSESRDEFID